MPLATRLLTSRTIETEQRYPLRVLACPACLLVQVDISVPQTALRDVEPVPFISELPYRTKRARLYAERMIERLGLTSQSLVVEIASNDGYLLKFFQEAGIHALGIEPAVHVAASARSKGIRTETLPFTAANARALARNGVAADLLVVNGAMGHVPDIMDFAAGLPCILAPEGVVSIEFPHLLNIIRDVQFDAICHENYFYLSLFCAEQILRAAGLRVFDAELLPTHGGSLRVLACHAAASFEESDNVATLRAQEDACGLHSLEAFRHFQERIDKAKQSFRAFLTRARTEGKKVAAYGIPARGNIFLNYCGIRPGDIAFAVDKSIEKQGKFLPGTYLPVRSPDALLSEKPDYVVILPWSRADEIRHAWARIADWGGRFVIGLPETRILAPDEPLHVHKTPPRPLLAI